MAGIGHLSAGNADENASEIINEISGQTTADNSQFVESNDIQMAILLELKLLNARIESAFQTGLDYEDLDNEFNTRY